MKRIITIAFLSSLLSIAYAGNTSPAPATTACGQQLITNCEKMQMKSPDALKKFETRHKCSCPQTHASVK